MFNHISVLLTFYNYFMILWHDSVVSLSTTLKLENFETPKLDSVPTLLKDSSRLLR